MLPCVARSFAVYPCISCPAGGESLGADGCVPVRDLDASLANRFVSMYVNERTLSYGADGQEAIRKLLALGHERGIIPIEPKVDFVD